MGLRVDSPGQTKFNLLYVDVQNTKTYDTFIKIPKSNRKNIFYTATQRKKFTVRIVQRYKIEEIESLDNR